MRKHRGTQKRQRQYIKELNEQWGHLSKHLERLEKEKIFETDPSKKLQLEERITELTIERQEIEHRLNILEHQQPQETNFE